MFPLQIHKGAREQCVAVVCDKKGFADLDKPCECREERHLRARVAREQAPAVTLDKHDHRR